MHKNACNLLCNWHFTKVARHKARPEHPAKAPSLLKIFDPLCRTISHKQAKTLVEKKLKKILQNLLTNRPLSCIM